MKFSERLKVSGIERTQTPQGERISVVLPRFDRAAAMPWRNAGVWVFFASLPLSLLAFLLFIKPKSLERYPIEIIGAGAIVGMFVCMVGLIVGYLRGRQSVQRS